MYFSQLLCYIECCHRTVGLPYEDGAVINISLISVEVGIKYKESFPPLLIVLFLAPQVL